MSALPLSTDVFVVGGGPAGLAAAIAARRRGFDVTVADCSAPPIDKACGEGIMPDGLAAARSLGLDFSSAGGYSFDGIRFHETTSRGPVQVESEFPHGSGLGLRRTTLHEIMVDRAAAAGVHLAWGARITGIRNESVLADGRTIRAKWIIGADGGHSPLRRWAGLDRRERDSVRFGFRRHYRIAPWTRCMEIYWGNACQVYVTPVSEQEVCVVLISGRAHLRLDDALPQFPDLARRLASAPFNTERGGISASRRLKSVCRGNVALVGDASGSVDAITGEGLCLLFQQAVAIAGAIASGDLSTYQSEHRRIGRHPERMARLMLLLDNRGALRRRVLRAMSDEPRLFKRMLALHVAEPGFFDLFTNALDLGRHLLTV